MAFMDKIRDFDPDKIPLVKLGLHVFQILLGFVIFALEIAIFLADKAEINGKNGWTFALFFLSIPAWIYLALAPRFERTRKIAQAHAMTVVDSIWTIFWLSGFATQVSYNSNDMCGTACNLSAAVAGLAFFAFIAWVGSTLVSGYTLNYYQFHGELPGYDKLGRLAGQNIDPDKAAFSMAPHDEEAYAPVNLDDHHDDDDHHHTPYNADSYGSGGSGAGGMFQSDTSYRPQDDGGNSLPPQNPFAQSEAGDNPFDNSYRTHTPLNANAYADPYRVPSAGPYGASPSPAPGPYGSAPGPHIYSAPTVDDYSNDQPAQFPHANYDRTLH